MTLARDERLALCALLDETGPDAPTLCEGWTTRDLAAHLVLRENRMDAGIGILGGPLAGYTSRVQHRLSERTSFSDLVTTIRNGPPRLSVFGLPGVDERANVVEFFVHHEDVRRGSAGWAERKMAPALADALWRRLSMARMVLRKAPVGVELARDDVTDPGCGAGADHGQGPDPGGHRDRQPRGTDPVGPRPDRGRPGAAGRQRARGPAPGRSPLARLTRPPRPGRTNCSRG